MADDLESGAARHIDELDTEPAPRTDAHAAMNAAAKLPRVPLKVESVPRSALNHEFAPPADAPTSGGGLEAAQAAAASTDSAQTSAQPTDAALGDPIAATVATARMVFALAVTAIVKVQRVKLEDGELGEMVALDKDESAIVAQFAPAAAPWLAKATERAPHLGALLFLGSLALPLADRIGKVRRIKRENAIADAVTREVEKARAADASSSADAPSE